MPSQLILAAGQANPQTLRELLGNKANLKKALPTVDESDLSLLHLIIGAPWRHGNGNESGNWNQAHADPDVDVDADCQHCLSLLVKNARYYCNNDCTVRHMYFCCVLLSNLFLYLIFNINFSSIIFVMTFQLMVLSLLHYRYEFKQLVTKRGFDTRPNILELAVWSNRTKVNPSDLVIRVP